MLRLAICEDDSYVVEELEVFLEGMHDTLIEYDVFFSANELENELEYNEFDAFFLDIELGKESGIELARNIRRYNQYAVIVFITSYPQYVYDAFDVIAFDYIIKPLCVEKIRNVISNISEYLFFSNRTFVFMSNRKKYAIHYKNLIYFEKCRNKINIYTNTYNNYTSNMTIEEVIKRLPEDLFVRINRGCIVNISMITEIVKEEVKLTSGQTLYTTRELKMNLKSKHLEFIKTYL